MDILKQFLLYGMAYTQIAMEGSDMKVMTWTYRVILSEAIKLPLMIALIPIICIPHTLNAQQNNPVKNYQVIVDESDKQNITGYFSIADIWGEQLQPPQNLKRGIINLKEAMNKWTKIHTSMESHVYLNSNKINDLPFIYVTTKELFEVTKQEIENLKKYFDNGGFMVIEDAEPVSEHSMGAASLKQMVREVIPNARFAPIPNDHAIYHCFFDFSDGPPQGAELGVFDGMTAKKIYYLEGVWYKGRLAVVYSDKGYIIKWNQGSENDPQLKMGVNLIVYALTQEGGMAKPLYK